jgi:high affinity sulfate transporter 1
MPDGTSVERWVPAVGMVRHYRRGWIGSDLVAGLVLAAILVPQGMAYAELAGLPAVNGLYATIGCLLGYAVFGPSRILVLGPDASLGPMVFAAIAPLAVTGDPAELVALAGMLALIVGGIEIAMGLGKLGFIADLLSKEIQVGYMIGLGITIVVGQLPKLFGFSTDADTFLGELRAFVNGLDERNRTTLVVGLASLALMLVLPRLTRRVPAVLVTVILSTLAVRVFDLTSKGVTTVGSLPQGLPRPTFPSVDWNDIGPLLAAAIGITFVSLADTIATSTSFAARRGEEVHPSKEMIGLGAANGVAGFLQGFPVSTSGSRTAVAEQAGAKSQVTGLVGAGVVCVMLLFLPDLLASLPNSALAAIVIAAALSLMDFAAMARFWRIRSSAFALALAATLGVVFFGVLEGILVAVALSILMFFKRGWWPTGEVLGRVASLGSWHRLDVFPDAVQMPGVVVLRWEAPLFFANASAFRQEIRRLVRRMGPRRVVLQCEAITDIDVTAAEMLKGLDSELAQLGVELVFVRLRTHMRELLTTYGLGDTFGESRFHASIDDACSGAAPNGDHQGESGAHATSPSGLS